MANDCPQHSGQPNEDKRMPYDAVMGKLDNNQSGEGRHKCPYCAYERGYEQGKDDLRLRIAKCLDIPLDGIPH